MHGIRVTSSVEHIIRLKRATLELILSQIFCGWTCLLVTVKEHPINIAIANWTITCNDIMSCHIIIITLSSWFQLILIVTQKHAQTWNQFISTCAKNKPFLQGSFQSCSVLCHFLKLLALPTNMTGAEFKLFFHSFPLYAVFLWGMFNVKMNQFL